MGLNESIFDLAMACGASANSLTRSYAALQLCHASVAMAITLAATLRGSIVVRGPWGGKLFVGVQC